MIHLMQSYAEKDTKKKQEELKIELNCINKVYGQVARVLLSS